MKSAMRWIHLSDLHIDPPSDGRSTEELRADFILDIAEAAKIKITNIYLIPGNHDLNRTKEKERIKNIRKGYDLLTENFVRRI